MKNSTPLLVDSHLPEFNVLFTTNKNSLTLLLNPLITNLHRSCLHRGRLYLQSRMIMQNTAWGSHLAIERAQVENLSLPPAAMQPYFFTEGIQVNIFKGDRNDG